MPQKAIDWAAIDWHRPTRVIAEAVGRSENTVSKARRIHAPDTRCMYRSKYRYTPESKASQLAQVMINNVARQRAATASARVSPYAGRFETNVHAKRWEVVTPDGDVYIILNLYHWVREHEDLFDPLDVVWKRRGGGRITGGEYCNATAGLLNVRSGKSRAWKGWTLRVLPDSPAAADGAGVNG